MFRYLSADSIFPISSPPLKKGIVVTDDSGRIEGVHAAEEFESIRPADVVPEQYSGILCPGFINAHCHLELSHLKGKIKPGLNGLPGFIGELLKFRNANPEEKQAAIEQAETEMIANGIVAVGDICNTADTIFQKEKKHLRYHNFIELFDLHPDQAEREYEKGLALYEQFRRLSKSVSLSPHAPYTVTPALLKRIHEHTYAHDSAVTFHNQETPGENDMFRTGTGILLSTLASMVPAYQSWKPTGFSSLASTLVHLSKCNRTLLVHNTFSGTDDVSWAHLYSPVISWCLCPNANLFIENTLPNLNVFIEGSCRILVGTDSYASNWNLSILEELKTIAKNYPKIRLETLLNWATQNGAIFYGWENELGSLEKGKRPGINLLSGINLETHSFTDFSEVKPLVKIA